MIFRVIFFLVFFCEVASGAIVSEGGLGIGSLLSSGTTLSMTTTVTAPVNRVIIVRFSFNNTNTGNGDFNELTSVSDATGKNSYTKLCEFTNGQGAAAAGITVSAWRAKVAVQLDVGQTITATFANTITSRAMGASQYSVGVLNTLDIAGSCQTLANDAADPGSLTITGLSAKEYMFYRVIANEGFGVGYNRNSGLWRFYQCSGQCGNRRGFGASKRGV